MKTTDSRPIFIQIKNWIEDRILIGKWSADEQLLSVRELSVEFNVNPNTVVRTYERLIVDGTIYSVRGVGFFVSKDASQAIIERRRKEFYALNLPAFIDQMTLLGVEIEEVVEYYNQNNETNEKKK